MQARHDRATRSPTPRACYHAHVRTPSRVTATHGVGGAAGAFKALVLDGFARARHRLDPGRLALAGVDVDAKTALVTLQLARAAVRACGVCEGGAER